MKKITLKPTMTVSELLAQLDGDYQVSTLKGNAAGAKRRLRALTETSEKLIDIEVTEEDLVAQLYEQTGIQLQVGADKESLEGKSSVEGDERADNNHLFNVKCLTETFPDANQFDVRFNTDHWILLEEGWEPEAAFIQFTVNKKGELLSWTAYDDEVIPYLEIPDTWHDLKRICSGTIEVDGNEREIADEPVNDEESFYELCCDILEFVQEQ
jgi:hypothetical protein